MRYAFPFDKVIFHMAIVMKISSFDLSIMIHHLEIHDWVVQRQITLCNYEEMVALKAS